MSIKKEIVEFAVKQFGKKAATKSGKEALEEIVARGMPAEALAVKPKAPRKPKPKAETPPAPGARRVYPAAKGVDPRIEKRKGEAPKVASLAVDVTDEIAEPPMLSVFDLEGKPVITSMSDQSAGGRRVTRIRDVPFEEGYDLPGGQDFMFAAPDAVWAADRGNAYSHMALAKQMRRDTGEDPLFMPWVMGPTSSAFSHIPRGLMLRYAAEAMPTKTQRRLSKEIAAIIPGFKSLDDPESAQAFLGATGKARGALNKLMDRYRTQGGLGMGEAITATNDPAQAGLPLTSLRNVGTISAKSDVAPSAHPSYNTAIPGEGIGRLREPVGALDFLPELRRSDDPFDFPVGVVPGESSPLRALQMKPRGFVVDDKMLRAIADRLGLKRGGRVKRQRPANRASASSAA